MHENADVQDEIAHAAARCSAIPRFDLYEEEVAEAREPDFLHIETIYERSHVRDWKIQPHRHDHLLQLLLVTRGGGALTLDGQTIAFEAPWVVALPPTIVHGFAFRRATEGFVLTTSEDFFLSSCLPDPDLSASFGSPVVVPLSRRATVAEITGVLERIMTEFAGEAPLRRAALGSLLKLLLVMIGRARLESGGVTDAAHVKRDGSYLRFRQLVDKQWRSQRSVGAYAGALGLTKSGLNAACKRASGTTAGQLIRERVLVEAKRQLIYTGMAVGEIAYDLGFSDPAYFTRVFRKATGEAPSHYRAARTQR